MFSIFPTSQVLDIDDLTTLEWRNIQEFDCLWLSTGFNPLLLPSCLNSKVKIPLYNVRSYSSRLYRLVVLMFISHIKNGSSDRRKFNYLVKLYSHVRKCFHDKSVPLLELVHASYLMAVFSLVGGSSIQEANLNCLQFSRAFNALWTMCTIDDDEFVRLETLWQKLVSSLYDIHRDNVDLNRIRQSDSFMNSIETMHGMLNETSFLLQVNPSMTTSCMYHKLISLTIYMQFHFDHFLLREIWNTDVEDARITSGELDKILKHIAELFAQHSNICDYINDAYLSELDLETDFDTSTNKFSCFSNVQCSEQLSQPTDRDVTLGLVYVFHRLVKDILESTAENDKTVNIYRLASALCRLCMSFQHHSLTFISPIRGWSGHGARRAWSCRGSVRPQGPRSANCGLWGRPRPNGRYSDWHEAHRACANRTSARHSSRGSLRGRRPALACPPGARESSDDGACRRESTD